jgi:hypothetical protein
MHLFLAAPFADSDASLGDRHVKLWTLGSGEKQDITEKELRAAFLDDEARGEGIFLESEDGATLLAAGGGFGPYTLEYFPSPSKGTHLRACDELKKQEVQDAMVDYLRGGSAWRESYAWREVEDEKSEGCLRVVLALTLAVAPWLLIIAGMSFIVYALGKFLAFPGGGDAVWGIAGLICLILGALFVLALRTRSRSTPGAGGPKGSAGDPLD